MTWAASRVSGEIFEELRKHFNEGEVVEIAAVVGLFNYFNRFNEALGMEPTKPGEGLDS
jgi:alkylhydroperoxidase family enzyme